ncbi:MAG: hypothetical protein AAB426_02010, partial [Myxococcota bacterium]
MEQSVALAGESLESRLLHVFLYLGSQWVLYLLLGLSVLSIAIAAERLLHFWRRREDLIVFRHELEGRLNRGQLDEVRTLLEGSRSHVATVVLRGLDAFGRGAPAVEELIASASQLERLQMERGLSKREAIEEAAA